MLVEATEAVSWVMELSPKYCIDWGTPRAHSLPNIMEVHIAHDTVSYSPGSTSMFSPFNCGTSVYIQASSLGYCAIPMDTILFIMRTRKAELRLQVDT